MGQTQEDLFQAGLIQVEVQQGQSCLGKGEEQRLSGVLPFQLQRSLSQFPVLGHFCTLHARRLGQNSFHLSLVPLGRQQQTPTTQLFFQPLRGVVGQELAVVQDDDLVTDRLHLGQDVGTQDHRVFLG